jgi:hypothetical protein
VQDGGFEPEVVAADDRAQEGDRVVADVSHERADEVFGPDSPLQLRPLTTAGSIGSG